MDKLEYGKIMAIQESATKKLLNYIGNFLKKEKFLTNIDFDYPEIDEERTMIAFNIWLSLDYKTRDGKNFIEHLLEEKSDTLTNLEKEVLIERNKCHISIYKINSIKGDLIYIEDVILKEKCVLDEPELSKLVNPSDLVFGRVATVLSYKKFIGDISFLPKFIEDDIVEDIYNDYYKMKIHDKKLSMEKYLKKYSSNVYKIYTDYIYNIIDQDDEDDILSEELDDFEEYLYDHFSEKYTERHINNLVDIYDYYLSGKNMTISDLKDVDMNLFIKDAIKDGFIRTKTELNSYISTLKKYFGFLKGMDPNFNNSYENILKIQNKKNDYMKDENALTFPLQWNNEIQLVLKDNISEKSTIFIKDYEIFLDYIKNNDVKLTSVRKHINRDNLFKLNLLFKNKRSMNPLFNQTDYPLINLYYYFSLCYNFAKIEKNRIYPTKDVKRFHSLKQEEKLALFIEYLWNIFPWDREYETKNFVLETISKYKAGITYDFDKFLKDVLYDFPFIRNTIMSCFDYMGLVKINRGIHTIVILPQGKQIFSLLEYESKKLNNAKNIGKLIYIKKYEEKNK